MDDHSTLAMNSQRMMVELTTVEPYYEYIFCETGECRGGEDKGDV